MMSKRSYLLPPAFAAAAILLLCPAFSWAQDLHASFKVDAASPKVLQVEGRFARPRPFERERTIRFLTDYAGVNGLALRISSLELRDVNGRSLAVRKIAEGEFAADGPVTSWSCKYDLTPIQRTSASTHLSWIGPEGGLIMVDDIMPQDAGRSALIGLDVPAGWKVWTTSSTQRDGRFVVDNIERAAFAVGPMWREGRSKVSGGQITVLMSGTWQFTDQEMAATIDEVLGHYAKQFSWLPGNIQIALHRFPFDANPGEWEADTRGASITIASSDTPFKSQSVQRLHEQLRHEVFHLWIPNGLNLTGRYDWFYEGFAMYQSLKLGVGIGRIRFEDMLDTLSRAYTIDATNPRRVSLIESSSTRWSGGNLSVYARGMVVGFLCDVSLLNETKRKVSTDDIVRDLYSRHSTGDPKDGNMAIIALLKERKSLVPIVDRYIQGTEAIDWAAYLAIAGIEARQSWRQTTLSIVAKPSGKQKDMLDKLGYNSWRKVAGSK
jgi:predicted metalloprotease with PDZ domain